MLYIYLSTSPKLKEDTDFLTPFVKIFSHFSINKDDYYGRMTLWYLRKCILGQIFPTGFLDINTHTSILKKFLLIFSPSFLQPLLTLNAKLLF